MKYSKKLKPGFSYLLVFALIVSQSLFAQPGLKDQKIINDAAQAKEDFINTDGLMKSLFANAYGYVILPNVGKGGIGIGGAAGNGAVYEKGILIGMARMTQITIGFQWGGQAYREVIFFETESDLERFKESRLELSAQASAVAVTTGASANAKYVNGVMIFTQTKGGLMYEASIGGQQLVFREL